MDSAIHYPYYIPDDILAYEEPVPSYAEKAFLTFIGQLRVTAKVDEESGKVVLTCRETDEEAEEKTADPSFMNEIKDHDQRRSQYPQYDLQASFVL